MIAIHYFPHDGVHLALALLFIEVAEGGGAEGKTEGLHQEVNIEVVDVHRYLV